ncbi:MAG: TRAP transporter small permease [Deltaproteobacteria bacterium]|nr:TRAP transporter small permease [Deltaproteobacteria bacterium]
MDAFVDRLYRVIRFILDDVVANVAALVLFSATALAVLEIFRRYVFGVVFEWGQDAVTFMVISAMFLYFAVTQARRGHLVMSAGIDVLRARRCDRLILVLRLIVSIVSLSVFMGFAIWGGPTLQRTITMGRKTQSMVLDLWPFQACLLIGFGLMALVTLFHLYQDLRAIMGKPVFPWAPAEESTHV